VDDGPHALLSSEGNGRKRRHPWLSGVIVGQADQVNRVSQRCDPLAQAARVRRAWERNLG
jgi:hypothetical protein